MRFLLSWTLYWLGDIICRPMERFDWVWLYPTYNKLMCWSSSVQGKTKKGPWGKIK